MYLKDIINLLYAKGIAIEKMNIHIKNMNGDTFYNGVLNFFHQYINTHNMLDPDDGFPRQVMCVDSWNVVEVLVDRSREEENNLPDYNKGKIIVVM